MRSRLDFVQPGTVAGQITSVGRLVGNDHVRYRDGPNGEPIPVTVPGIDTEVTLSGHPFKYRVHAIETDDGPRIVELHIDSPGHDVVITADDMRKIARLLDRLAYAAVRDVDVETTAFHKPEQPPPERPGRKGHGDDHYREVAKVALAAHRDYVTTGVSARQAIAKHWTVSVHTADKWQQKARDRGFLKAGDLGGKPAPNRQNRT